MTVTVLVVDDSKLARIVAGKAISLLQPDWRRIEAANADEALRLILEQPVDLAVLDYNMPGKDGLELASELRASHPQMPIAIITANVQDEIITRARAINATFVSKPVTEDGISGFLSGAALPVAAGKGMIDYDIALDELERDALTEVVNIGVSRAAASLRKMVGRQVLLSVPAVEVVTQKAAAALIGQQESEGLVAVKQDFEGAFSGRALLIFPESRSLELVRAIVGEDFPASEIPEIEAEALMETGNIILNSCLGTMANMLQKSLKMSLPEVVRGDGPWLFDVTAQSDNEVLVLFLYINFSVRERNIRGYIAMLMDLPSLAALKVLIGDFISRVTAEAV